MLVLWCASQAFSAKCYICKITHYFDKAGTSQAENCVYLRVFSEWGNAFRHGINFPPPCHILHCAAPQNYFQGLEINFKATKIYFKGEGKVYVRKGKSVREAKKFCYFSTPVYIERFFCLWRE